MRLLLTSIHNPPTLTTYSVAHRSVAVHYEDRVYVFIMVKPGSHHQDAKMTPSHCLTKLAERTSFPVLSRRPPIRLGKFRLTSSYTTVKASSAIIVMGKQAASRFPHFFQNDAKMETLRTPNRHFIYSDRREKLFIKSPRVGVHVAVFSRSEVRYFSSRKATDSETRVILTCDVFPQNTTFPNRFRKCSSLMVRACAP